MTTVQDVWGFSRSLTINVDINEFMQKVDRFTKERGLKSNVPSDGLDASRDLILTEAANEFDSDWQIVGTQLRVWPRAYASEFTDEFWKRNS